MPHLADTFCRVQGSPRETVLPLLERVVDWRTPDDYVEHLKSLPLGPHVIGMLGHSTARSHVMGLARSLDETATPDAEEMSGLARLTSQASAAARRLT